jgi:hypothetical protein
MEKPQSEQQEAALELAQLIYDIYIQDPNEGTND